MQHPLCFALLAAGQLLLALSLPATAAQGPVAGAGDLAGLIAAGLCLDNAVLAAGAPLQARDRLLPFSRARYLLHALVTPLLLPLAVLTARGGGLAVAWLLPLAWGLSATWMLAAWAVGYRHLDLQLQRQGPLVRHHNASRHGQPWLRLLLLAVVLVILGLASQVPNGAVAAAMRAGALAMLAGALLARKLGLAVANLGELLLMGSLGTALLI